MKNVKILDCTLRDGGRIFDCRFSDSEIREIIEGLNKANINIIEVGFLRDKDKISYSGNSTFFTDVKQIERFIDHNANKEILYTAFIDYGLFNFNYLDEHNANSINGIRFGFTKSDFKTNKTDIIKCMNIIKDKGYLLFVQQVNSLAYTNEEILELISIINEIKPFSYGIVDTYGAMYSDDLKSFYKLIDSNLNKDICIDFHSHNNYQLSFSLAQEIIKISEEKRNIIIDSTLNGMGKVAGNLNTELIIDYMIRKHNYNYDINSILDIIDKNIYLYAKKYKWGYSVPGMMAGIYRAHPNNIIFLTEKLVLNSKDIGNILYMIDPDTRQRYDYENIKNLYIKYTARVVDDSKEVLQLRKIFENKTVLILAPGDSLNTFKNEIKTYHDNHNAITISVNFVSNVYEDAYSFFGNERRYLLSKDKLIPKRTIITSNIKPLSSDNIIIDYYKLITHSHKYFENTVIMLFKLLRKLHPSHIVIAGFDGFDKNKKNNFSDEDFLNDRHIDEFDTLNCEIRQMFEGIKASYDEICDIEFLTPSLYNGNNSP